MRSYSICLSASNLSHLVHCPLGSRGSSILSQLAGSPSFVWLNNISLVQKIHTFHGMSMFGLLCPWTLADLRFGPHHPVPEAQVPPRAFGLLKGYRFVAHACKVHSPTLVSVGPSLYSLWARACPPPPHPPNLTGPWGEVTLHCDSELGGVRNKIWGS